MAGQGDMHAQRPTLDEEMAKFKTISTTDGELSDGKATAEEAARLAANADGQAAAAATAAATAPVTKTAPAAETVEEGGTPKNETPEQKAEREASETPEQKAAREAVDARIAKQSAVDKRIGQATAKQRAAERALAAEREERARERGAWEARISALEKGPLTAAKAEDKKDPNAPRPEDFEFGTLDEKYIRALARYEAKQEILAEQQTQRQNTETAAQAAARAEFQTKLDAFQEAGVKKFGDGFIEDVVESGRRGDWPLPAVVGELIFESPQGPEIAHFLSQPENLAEAQRIEKLKPASQAAAFGRLEAKFSTPVAVAADDKTDTTVKATVPATKAPPVPQSRARGAGGKAQVSPETSDFAAFEAMAMGRAN